MGRIERVKHKVDRSSLGRNLPRIARIGD